MKRWMLKKAGTMALAAATGLSVLSPAPLWSQNQDSAGSEIQRRLAELYAREGKTAPQSAPQQAPRPAVPVTRQHTSGSSQRVPQFRSLNPGMAPTRQTSHPTSSPVAQPENQAMPVEVELNPRPTSNTPRVPMGIQAPVTGDTPKVTNAPVAPNHPLITPGQAAANREEREWAPPVPAIRPIPFPVSKTEPKSDAQSQQGNPTTLPVVKQTAERGTLSPFAKPGQDVKFTPHPLGSHPLGEVPMTKKPKHQVGNPFEMPVVQERPLNPPRPVVVKPQTKTESKPEVTGPFEMPVVQETSPPKPKDAAPTSADGNPFLVLGTAAPQPGPEVQEIPLPEVEMAAKPTPKTAEQPSSNEVASTQPLPEIALNGCCPVTLREQNKHVEGRPELVCVWEQACYQFASPEAQRKFESNPNYYVADSTSETLSHSETVAMEGCCPVTLCEDRKFVQGQPDLVCTWKKATYRFASVEAKQKFEQNPNRYAPAESGLDITLLTDAKQTVPGSLKYAVWYHKELYLFQSEATQNSFTANPGKYCKQQ